MGVKKTSSEVKPGNVNLTDLADRFGSDKGSTKHRYTELYHMLFYPYRKRKIRFLEMGLLIGGPEHGISKDRETSDLPSIRMWLEYFPAAEVTGLDISDFSWFSHSRFSFLRCDMEQRKSIADTLAEQADFDIIIDDASHASHHQQFGFLELFSKLKSGGLYIIEDLRWQPKTYERPDFTKTAALFQSYLVDREFSHSDSGLAKEFNALRDQMSGVFIHQAKFVKARKDQVLVIHKR